MRQPCREYLNAFHTCFPHSSYRGPRIGLGVLVRRNSDQFKCTGIYVFRMSECDYVLQDTGVRRNDPSHGPMRKTVSKGIVPTP
jgi:hypothetical protein